MYTLEFIDGPWEGQTYDTHLHHEEIKPRPSQTSTFEEGIYRLVSEKNNTLVYQFSPQTFL